LSAASNALKALLGETFSEGQQIQQGQPIEIGASDEVVRALLDHIYGGEPEITPASATELLRLAGAYELPKLCAEIELVPLLQISSDFIIASNASTLEHGPQ
jgi:hypothetical protein